MVLRDLAQAVNDLGLVLALTAGLLALLFVAGWGLRRRALKLQIRAEKTERLLTKREQEAVRLYYAASFQQGISTELFGAVFTTLAFGVVLLIFQQYQDVQNRKAELILQMGSPDNAFAVEAVRQLDALGWLEDGTLQGADLTNADLQGADLQYANLQGADLSGANLLDVFGGGANLQGADLGYVNLHGANLEAVNLQEADLSGAKLQGAGLGYASLQRADLQDANLQSAWLVNANLEGANLYKVNLQWATLGSVNLQDAILQQANLQDAILQQANLQGADLQDANLQDTDLQYVNLQGTILWKANLQGANLAGAVFDDKTVLPDGKWTRENDANNHTIYTPESYYQPGVTDMTRYTDPNHPDFWQPDWVTEQAEQGNG